MLSWPCMHGTLTGGAPLLPSVGREEQMDSCIVGLGLPCQVGVDHAPDGGVPVREAQQLCVHLRRVYASRTLVYALSSKETPEEGRKGTRWSCAHPLCCQMVHQPAALRRLAAPVHPLEQDERSPTSCLAWPTRHPAHEPVTVASLQVAAPPPGTHADLQLATFRYSCSWTGPA
jgi:hypothetical protein